ncbi:MAG TPA: SDR family oxidoreductase [Ferruginibacter sp.]|nr:SDR family oxidoreductase [Ferruginibacter sp.]
MNVVITGASRGIGKAIATAYATEGATLFLSARNELTLYNTVAELQTKFPNSSIKAKAFDLSVKVEAQKFGQWVLSFGTPGILVNNAGQFLPGNISTEDDGILEETIAANLYSAYHLTRTVVGKMIEAKQGHIFNICSIAALKAYHNGGSYSISKFALMGFSKNLREELKPHHIKVTSVYPGAVMTDSWAGFDNSAGRIMEAEDIAKMILAASKLSHQAVVEEIILRPQLGDL